MFQRSGRQYLPAGLGPDRACPPVGRGGTGRDADAKFSFPRISLFPPLPILFPRGLRDNSLIAFGGKKDFVFQFSLFYFFYLQDIDASQTMCDRVVFD